MTSPRHPALWSASSPSNPARAISASRVWKPRFIAAWTRSGLGAHFVSGARSSRDELLAAVDIERRARQCCVAHDVNGQRGDVSRSDDAPDGQRRAELLAPLLEVVAED